MTVQHATSARSAALAFALAMTPAQAPAIAQSAFSIVANQPAGETNIGNLIGAKVFNDAGEQLGDVNYLLVNSSGQISTAVIGVGGFLGVGEKNVGFPFSVLKITPGPQGERQIKLSATKIELQAAPKFEWRETPMAVQVEESLKSAADKVKATAKTLSDKASEAMKKN